MSLTSNDGALALTDTELWHLYMYATDGYYQRWRTAFAEAEPMEWGCWDRLRWEDLLNHTRNLLAGGGSLARVWAYLDSLGATLAEPPPDKDGLAQE